MMPENKREAVEKALRTAFHTGVFESIALLAGGYSSALVYKIVVSGKPYLLRLVMWIDALSDLAREVCYMICAMFSMKIAAGKISRASYEGQLLCGKVLLNEALRNMKMPRFAESIERVRAR